MWLEGASIDTSQSLSSERPKCHPLPLPAPGRYPCYTLFWPALSCFAQKKMHILPSFITWASLGFPSLTLAVCPYADPSAFRRRDEAAAASGGFYDQFTVDSKDEFLTNDFGGPIGDQFSLKAGDRGSTLLEDFIFREKITRFDHERVGSSCRCYISPLSSSMLLTSPSTRSPSELSTPAVLAHMAPSPAMGTSATSRPLLSSAPLGRRPRPLSVSPPSLALGGVQTPSGISAGLPPGCTFLPRLLL